MKTIFDQKWQNVLLLKLAVLLAMSLWFSATAVVPTLANEWNLTAGQQAWMTISVQIGFALGALVSAALNLADRMPVQRLFAFSVIAGALFNAAIALFVNRPGPMILLRLLTGATMAGVYPPSLKLIATWCKEDLGFGISLLIASLTVGSAVPHLVNALLFLKEPVHVQDWRSILVVSSVLALVSAWIIARWVKTGPFNIKAFRFNWIYAAHVFKSKAVRLANFGYLGHMWELYAMWTWVPVFLLTSYQEAGISVSWARAAGFGVVAIGGLGSLSAGLAGDRMGRTFTAGASLFVSGSCALFLGLFFNSPVLATLLCLIWGFFVVADSAQFSAAVSELGDPRYIGTALTLQTSLGFLLTVLPIHLIPRVRLILGWEWAFLILVPGPVFGIWSMYCLRQLSAAEKMASGNR